MCVEIVLEPSHRGRSVGVLWVNGAQGRGLGIGPSKDVRGVGENALSTPKHRCRETSSSPVCSDTMDCLYVGLLHILDAGTVKCPACLLAVVADGDRYEDVACNGFMHACISLLAVLTII